MANSISGNTAGIVGVTVSYTGTASGSVTSTGGGAFTILGLASGTYTITPTKAGVVFSQSVRVVIVASNVTGIQFTAGGVTPAGTDTDISATSEVTTNPAGETNSNCTSIMGTNRGSRIIG